MHGPASTSIQFRSPCSYHKPEPGPCFRATSRSPRSRRMRAVLTRRKIPARRLSEPLDVVPARTDRVQGRACGRCGPLAGARARGHTDLEGSRVLPVVPSARLCKGELWSERRTSDRRDHVLFQVLQDDSASVDGARRAISVQLECGN
jgi:hypothetical protein